MGIVCSVSTGESGDQISHWLEDLSAAIKMLVDLTHDAGANLSVQITYVDETRVSVGHTIFHAMIPETDWESLVDRNDHFVYSFGKDPDDHGDTFDKFLFVASCVVKAVPWICTPQVLRRVVGGDELAYQPA